MDGQNQLHVFIQIGQENQTCGLAGDLQSYSVLYQSKISAMHSAASRYYFS